VSIVIPFSARARTADHFGKKAAPPARIIPIDAKAMSTEEVRRFNRLQCQARLAHEAKRLAHLSDHKWAAAYLKAIITEIEIAGALSHE